MTAAASSQIRQHSAMQGRVADAVTALFVPGDRPDRYAKAAASGAGVVIIDLEDAVAPEAKGRALHAACESLSGSSGTQMQALIRINQVDAPTYDTEVAALLELAMVPRNGMLGVMVPKVESAESVQSLGQNLRDLGLGLIPLVESAAGAINALEIAQVPGVTRLAFGAVDYGLDINAVVDDEERVLDHVRSTLVIMSRAAGLAAPLDSPALQIQDVERVGAAARRARAFGFGGKLCIHPYQVEIVQNAFRPVGAEVQWARSIVESAAGASQVNGQMIDRPVIERARRVLAHSGEDQ